MTDTPILLSSARILTAILAGVIAVFAARAYLALRRRNLLALAGGATVLSAGYLVEGVLVEFGGWSLARASSFESVMTLLAAALLVLSLYLRDVRHTPARPRSLP